MYSVFNGAGSLKIMILCPSKPKHSFCLCVDVCKLKETRWILEAKYSFIILPKIMMIIIMNQRAVDSLCCMNVFFKNPCFKRNFDSGLVCDINVGVIEYSVPLMSVSRVSRSRFVCSWSAEVMRFMFTFQKLLRYKKNLH